MNKDKIYIAYGSNLNLKQMSLRCPTAKVIGKTEIKDYHMLFRGSKTGAFATIEPCEGKNVPVLLWSVKASDEKALDRYEGYPTFYGKDFMTIAVDNKEINAFVYVMVEGQALGVPSKRYINTIMEGYENAGFNMKILENALTETLQGMDKEREKFFGFGGMKDY
ncbi:MAG: gamma-glutamylcyclotransferase family protein [Anaerotignaceae bacterium]